MSGVPTLGSLVPYLTLSMPSSVLFRTIHSVLRMETEFLEGRHTTNDRRPTTDDKQRKDDTNRHTECQHPTNTALIPFSALVFLLISINFHPPDDAAVDVPEPSIATWIQRGFNVDLSGTRTRDSLSLVRRSLFTGFASRSSSQSCSHSTLGSRLRLGLSPAYRA